MNNNEIALTNNETEIRNFTFNDEGFNVNVDLTSKEIAFCSMKPVTKDEQIMLFNAMNNPNERLSDCVNKVINVRDIYVEVVNCSNEETGIVTKCPRIVLIDTKGTSYQCVSIGIYSALKKAIQVFGTPTWDKGIPFEIKSISKGSKRILTLNVVNSKN